MTGTLVVKANGKNEVIEWDTSQNGGGALDPCHAKARFEEVMADSGLFAFAQVDGEMQQIRKGGFDPETQEKVFVSPQIAGG